MKRQSRRMNTFSMGAGVGGSVERVWKYQVFSSTVLWISERRAKTPQSGFSPLVLPQTLRMSGDRAHVNHDQEGHTCARLGVLACVSAGEGGGGTQGWKPAPGGAARCWRDLCSCIPGTSSVA